jgi:hypothetical protein
MVPVRVSSALFVADIPRALLSHLPVGAFSKWPSWGRLFAGRKLKAERSKGF